jgi:hypothetical protein
MINIIIKSWTSSSAKGAYATFGFFFPMQSYHLLRQALGNNVQINVILPNGVHYVQNITPSFFRNCHEIRNSNIRTFFVSQGLHVWNYGNPNTFNATFDGITLTVLEYE